LIDSSLEDFVPSVFENPKNREEKKREGKNARKAART
jgi:hypothetical protein